MPDTPEDRLKALLERSPALTREMNELLGVDLAKQTAELGKRINQIMDETTPGLWAPILANQLMRWLRALPEEGLVLVGAAPTPAAKARRRQSQKELLEALCKWVMDNLDHGGDLIL